MTNLIQEILNVPDSPIPISGDTLLRDADAWISGNWGGNFDAVPPQMRITLYIVHCKPGWLEPGIRRAAESIIGAQAELSAKRNVQVAKISRFMVEIGGGG